MIRLIKKHSALILNELDEADVVHDRCPNCRHTPLSRYDGFKACSNCGSVYKVFDGKSYVVVNRGYGHDGSTATSNNGILQDY